MKKLSTFGQMLFYLTCLGSFLSCNENNQETFSAEDKLDTLLTKNETITDTETKVAQKENFQFAEYTEIERFSGDLDGNGEEDLILVFETKKPSQQASDNSKDRRVAIYLQKEKKFSLYGFNDNLVDCSDCGGAGVTDPFHDVKIKTPYFSIESLYGACDKTFVVITFKFDSKTNQFLLHKRGSENYGCNDDDMENGEVKVTSTVETKRDFGTVEFTTFGHED